MESNFIGDQALSLLTEYLQNNQCIKYISIGSNITDEGINTLTDAIIGNTSLISLGIGHNKGITNKSVQDLAEIAMKTNITGLTCWNTSISQDQGNYLKELFAIPVEIREIPIISTAKSAAKSTIS